MMLAPLQTSRHRTRPRPSRRGGFTLIEVLVVIVVITILMALLAPAIIRARRVAQIARVRSEISGLEAAIAGFKSEFGSEPPGSIRLYPTGAGWNTADTGVNEIIRIRSRAYVKQLWPQFDFSTAGGATFTSVQNLNGAECLVFFLGGVPDSATGTTLNGFSKSPTAPFSTGGNNRSGPFYQFAANRLVNKDGDAMFEFVDTLPSQSSPYLYFSANDGRGYQTFTGSTSWCNTDNFADGLAQNTTFAAPSWTNGNWMQRLYYSSYTGTVGGASSSVAWQPKKFQIISPGYGGAGAPSPDAAYGSGGLFDPKSTGSLAGTADGDNITNIHQSTLSGE